MASGGLLLNVDVHAANIQNRDGAETLLRQARRRFPFVERIVADGSYGGPKMRALVGSWKHEIVKRSDVRGFVVLPKRCIVERTLAWISRNRRLARDYERQTRIAAIFVKLAMIRIMLRRIAITAQPESKLLGWAHRLCPPASHAPVQRCSDDRVRCGMVACRA